MKKTLIITTLLVVLMCGCNQPEKTEVADAKIIAKSLTYFRDEKTKICFAVASSRTYYGYLVNSITEVSCNKAFQDPNDPICGDPVEFKKHFPANASPATNANTHKH